MLFRWSNFNFLHFLPENIFYTHSDIWVHLFHIRKMLYMEVIHEKFIYWTELIVKVKEVDGLIGLLRTSKNLWVFTRKMQPLTYKVESFL